MAEYHLGKDNNPPFVPLQLWATTHITTWEEERTEVPREKTKMWKERFQVFDSEDVGFIQQETHPSDGYYNEYKHGDAELDVEDNEDNAFRSRKCAISVRRQVLAWGTGRQGRSSIPLGFSYLVQHICVNFHSHVFICCLCVYYNYSF
jgi:hypothetical protein